jgi:hypothetical protein
MCCGANQNVYASLAQQSKAFRRGGGDKFNFAGVPQNGGGEGSALYCIALEEAQH